MKESVPKDRKKMNMSTIEQNEVQRPLTPMKKEAQKNVKFSSGKNDYSTTPNKANNITATQIKLPEIKKEIELKEKRAKTDRKEHSKQIKDDISIKSKDVGDPKKEHKKTEEKKEKKEKTESIDKIANNEKKEDKKEKKKELEIVEKELPVKQKIAEVREVNYKSAEEKRKSSSSIPEVRSQIQAKPEPSQEIIENVVKKEDKRLSLKDRANESKRQSINKMTTNEEKRNEVFHKPTAIENKRQSVNKIAEVRSNKTPEPNIDKKPTTPIQENKRTSINNTVVQKPSVEEKKELTTKSETNPQKLNEITINESLVKNISTVIEETPIQIKIQTKSIQEEINAKEANIKPNNNPIADKLKIPIIKDTPKDSEAKQIDENPKIIINPQEEVQKDSPTTINIVSLNKEDTKIEQSESEVKEMSQN
jgi:hypothetical protein